MHELVVEPWAAACMEPGEWELWLARNPRNASGGAVDRPCADCPLGFALEMRGLGRCNGTPAGADDEDEEPAVTSVPAAVPDRLEAARTAAAPRRTIAPIRIASRPAPLVDVELELPCGRCVHVDVCSIRETLERTPIRIPAIARPHPAVSLELHAGVTCDHFLEPAITAAPRPAPEPVAPAESSRPRDEAQGRTRAPVDRRRHPTTTPLALTPRQTEVLALLRETGSRTATAKRMGVVYQSIDEVLKAVDRKGLLPADTPDLPKRLQRTGGST